MRFVEIELSGLVVRTLLDDVRAPATSQALWDALPFEGQAAHAARSGEMFGPLGSLPLRDLPVEGRSTYQHPGSVIYYPADREITFTYGNARFRERTGLPAFVTPVGEMEGDLTEVAARARALQFTGAQRMWLRKSEDQDTPFRFRSHTGDELAVEIDGERANATLLTDVAPVSTAALAKRLPLEGRLINDAWGVDVARVCGSSGRTMEVELGSGPTEAATTFLWPGFLYYHPATRTLRVCYGDGTIDDPGMPRDVTPVAAFEGDWRPVRRRLSSLVLEGEKRIRIARTDVDS